MARRASLLAVPILAVMVAAFLAPGAGKSVRHQGSAALPLGASGVVARTLARDDPRFWVRPASGGFATAGAGMNARFTRRGVTVGAAGLSWALGLRALGRGDHVSSVAPASPRGHENEVHYYRGFLDEWYANTRLGLEQGFTLSARAPGTAPLTLAIGELPHGVTARVGGDRRTAILTRGGRELLRYSGLLVSDARGRSLPAWIEASGRHLSLRLDDRDARYPLRVDPFVQVGKLTASDGAPSDFHGSSVAIFGNTIVAGAPRVNPDGNHPLQGAVYVFVEPAGGWASATETAKLTASDGAANDQFGSSVAISGDTIVAGAPHAAVGGNTDQGAVYVFAKPATGGWQTGTDTAKLVASDGMANDLLGSSVGVSGGAVLAGAFNQTIGANQAQGAAYVFVKPAGGWGTAAPTQAKLTASDGAARDDLAGSVAISGDTVVATRVGTPANGRIAGAEYVFLKPSGGWADEHEAAKLTPPAGGRIFGGGNTGEAVAISGDTVAAEGSNVVYVFVRPTGGWSDEQPTATLTESTGGTGDELGFSLAASGNTIVAGAPFADNSLGAAYVFTRPAGGWTDGHETQKLSPTQNTLSAAELGYAVGVEGGTIVAGAPAEDEGNVGQQGAAYVFTGSVGATSPTSTSVSCSPPSVTVGQSTSCTATVSDTVGGNAPSGSVALANDSCVLTATGTPGIAACSVAYTPTIAGTNTITANYGGDATHDPSTGSTTVTVSPGSTGGGGGGGGGNGGGGGGFPVAAFTVPAVARAGAVTTLNASASIDATQYQWDLNGDGTTDVTCGTPQLQTQFLPVTAVKPGADRATGHALPVAHVALTVVSATGQTSSVTQSVSLANANVTLPKAASNFYKTTQNGFCVGAGVMSQKICVVGAKESFGVIEAQGCDLHRVTGTQDLSTQEYQGLIQSAIDQYNSSSGFATYANVLCASAILPGEVPNCRLSQQLDQHDLTGMLNTGSIDLFECRGPISINGVQFFPSNGHPLVIAPQLETIFWSNTEIDLNDKALPLPSSGEFNFRDVNAPLSLIPGVYDRQSPPFAVDMHVPTGALPGLVGLTPQTATLSFARSTDGSRYTRIDASLALPSPLTALFSSSPPTFAETFTESNEADLQIGHIHVDGLPPIGYGPIEVDDVSVDYDSANPQPLRITGRIKFLGATVDFAPQLPNHPQNGILFYGRQFQSAHVTVDFSCPFTCPPDLFPGVTLNSIDAGISRNPWVLSGGGELGIVDLITFNTEAALGFASDADPWTLDRSWLPQLPDDFAPQTFTTLTAAAAGNATVNLPILDNAPLAHGYLIFAAPGYVSFGGSVSWSLAGIVSFDGGLTGEMNAVNKRFNFTGHLQSCVVDVICAGAFGVVSDAGAGACFSVGPVNVGGGIQFPSHVYIWPLDGCKWSRFTEDHVFDGARDAHLRGRQADLRPYVVHIAPGDSSRAISLDGDGEAPAVRITGPGGQDVSSSTGDCTPATDTVYNGSTCLTMVGHIRIMRSPTADQTVVGLQDPAPGTYTITPQPSSSGFTQVFTANDPAAPHITGSVAAAGVSRTLHYSVRQAPDENVTFFDVGPQGAREIGTAKGGATGALTFTPAPGNATHFVEADVEMAGLPVPMLGGGGSGALDASAARATQRSPAMITVARFQPPRLVHAGRIRRVRLHRRGTVLRVSWRKARGALRYAVTLRLHNGLVRTIVVRRTSATITGISRTEPGQITIAAIGDDGRRGPAVRARFRATAKPHTILRPLRQPHPSS